MDILSQLQEKLKEEQWTRAAIENFSIQSLEQLVQNIIKNHAEEKALEICLEFLKHSPKSIGALYVIGFLSYDFGDKENTLYLQQVIEIFKENKKPSVVEGIAQKILVKDPTNLYALNNLLTIYADLKKEKERFKVMQQIIKIDTKNGQVAQKLAEYYEQHPTEDKEGAKDIPNSVRYYQLALRRYAKVQNAPKVEEIWKKLASSHYDKINFFLNIALSIAETNLDFAISLLFNLVETLEASQLLDEAIFVLKRILLLEVTTPKVREKLIVIYKTKYKTNSQLTLCLENSGLENPKININSAIKKFEKEIQFRENGYVAHKVWGIGLLKKIENENFIIDFDDKKDHKMSYNMALSSLFPLGDEHIWVLKKLGKIKDTSSEEGIAYILLSILRSFSGKNLSIDDFKDELVPNIIPAKSWNTWWNKAKEILKEQPSIGSIKEGRPRYFIRSIDIHFEEELIEKFHQSKKFEEKIRLFEKFKKDVSNLDEFSDEFKEMVAYFESVLDSPRYEFNDKAITFVMLKKLQKTEPWAVDNISLSINDFMNEDDLFQLLMQNHKVEYKKDIIQLVLQHHPNYLDLLKDILFQDKAQIADFLMDQLEKNLKKEELYIIFEQGINSIFRENPLMTMWFLRSLLSKEHYKRLGFERDDLYAEVLYRIDTLGKLSAQKKLNWFKPPLYSVELKKVLTTANDILFSDSAFMDYIKEHPSRDYAVRVYQLAKSSLGLAPKQKLALMKAILDKHSDIDNDAKVLAPTQIDVDYLSESKIYTSQEGLDKQQKKLLALQKERNENLIELEKAREKGDLRENAEYQAAREKDSLLNGYIIELGEQINKSELLDLKDITGDKIIPGTVVTLERDGKKETYTILGFWDTDELHKIIAYNSPLARGILGLSKDETVTVELGGKDTTLKILNIKVAKG